jgi:PAS domain-containing protein
METTRPAESRVIGLVEGILGRARAEALVAAVEIDAALLRPPTDMVSRAELAQALNLLLFDDLLRRVPAGALYVLDRVRRGEKVVHDHGAVRTVLGETGALPSGERALTRVLAPLGYEVGEVYPLDRLGMTGRAWRHRDFPETIAQYFVSELHVDRFSPQFGETAAGVFGASRDPLPAGTRTALEELAAAGELPAETARRILPDLAGAFDRAHPVPVLADYERLLEESAEAAWIATEGNAFNHATDRVADVAALSLEELALGRPIKDRVEVSASGRVLQTAYRAASVERPFVGPDGALVLRSVPGSFFEFITRHHHEGGRLDLGFDTSNAQAIFKMTAPVLA